MRTTVGINVFCLILNIAMVSAVPNDIGFFMIGLNVTTLILAIIGGQNAKAN